MEHNKAQTKNDAIYYFNMNVPNWFANKPVQEKCEIIADLAKELEKNDNPIDEKEWDKLSPKD